MVFSRTWIKERTISTLGICFSAWALPLNIAYKAEHLRIDILCFFFSTTFYSEAEKHSQ
ncbi:hypothetical protein LCGC14_0792300 [marine sediment metagenome]|uniref:Uncharacterized protein n=1 Tax=marine sediment metagenome TaxID=412755 RepID=A0A0F9PSA4_9ZZZZ